jgi:hypothetical protein
MRKDTAKQPTMVLRDTPGVEIFINDGFRDLINTDLQG